MKRPSLKLLLGTLASGIAAQSSDTTILMDDPRLIYTHGGPAISFNDYIVGDRWNPVLCGGIVDLYTHGDSITFAFSGTAVQVNFLLDQSGGEAIVYFDSYSQQIGSNYGPVSVASATCETSTIYSGTLEARNHTVTVANRSGAAIYIHSFVFTPYGTQPLSPNQPASSKRSKGPLIGEIVGGVAGLLAIILLGYILWRDHKRQRARRPRSEIDGPSSPVLEVGNGAGTGAVSRTGPHEKEPQAADLSRVESRVDINDFSWPGASLPSSPNAITGNTVTHPPLVSSLPATPNTETVPDSESAPGSNRPLMAEHMDTIQRLLDQGASGTEITAAIRSMREAGPSSGGGEKHIHRAPAPTPIPPRYDFKGEAT